MDSKTGQPTVIDATKLQQLKDELQQEMCKIVNNANFTQILAKHGILRQEILEFQYKLDLAQLKLNDADKENKDQKSLLATLDINIATNCPNCTCTCWSRQLKEWIPCSCT
jgi:hypothetical protein